MSELDIQRDYWNRELKAFNSIYSKEKSGLSNLLDRLFRKDMFQRFEFTIKNSEPIEGRSFLDVGCGTGLYCMEFARRGAASVTGIDIAEKMVECCREAAKQEKVQGKCSFTHTDLLEFDADDRFDVTIGIGLFDYIGEALPVLKKMREVTKDRVIVSFPRFWTWRAPVRKVRLGVRGCPVYFFTKQKVARLMKQAGFARHTVEKVGKLHCVVGYCE